MSFVSSMDCRSTSCQEVPARPPDAATAGFGDASPGVGALEHPASTATAASDALISRTYHSWIGTPTVPSIQPVTGNSHKPYS